MGDAEAARAEVADLSAEIQRVDERVADLYVVRGALAELCRTESGAPARKHPALKIIDRKLEALACRRDAAVEHICELEDL